MKPFWQAVVALAGLAAAALNAGCQPLPRPFDEDRPPAGLLRVRDAVSISVAPVDGVPRATAVALGTAMARALQERDIAATEQAGTGSYQLYGRIEQAEPNKKARGKVSLVARWRLRDPNGQPVGERKQQVEATAEDWQKGKEDAVSRLAAASAGQLVGLLQEEAPVEAAGGGRTRLAVRKIVGAPGDGADSLGTAIGGVLKRQDLELISNPKGKADLYLDADVTVAPPKAGKQNVKIVWHVRRPDGSEVGTVGQENQVPTGMLNGPWGDVAYSIAISAGDGIMALVDRGGPPPA